MPGDSSFWGELLPATRENHIGTIKTQPLDFFSQYKFLFSFLIGTIKTDMLPVLYPNQNMFSFLIGTIKTRYTIIIICEGDILRQEYGRKILGILLACSGDPKLTEEVFKLIERDWPYIYRIVTREKGEEIDIFDVIIKAYKNRGEDFFSFPDNVIIATITITLFLTLNSGKKPSPNTMSYLSNLYSQRLEHYSPQSKIRLTYNSITPELKEKIKILKKDIYEKKGTIKNFSKRQIEHT